MATITITQEEFDALKANNDARAQKGLSQFYWDQDLARDAQNYANELASRNVLSHSSGTGQGENLFWGGGDRTLSEAVDAWLAEERDYHNEAIGEGNFMQYGHYTQCMWKSTVRMAVAKATASNGSTYIVGRYTPQGNWTGQRPY
ncbi:hypothetical protein AMS68_006207 [Peltaster fructicola]|uniref:SCP domain-containing protein n=1 Tax=Peltaster fructicola TaxID=286661 RepID=A0A6H0Y223_9PEZI|nr:hypothetical protein AMS68_006207 [Peltaster fructicola]